MAQLAKDQRSVVRRALRVAKRKGASPRETKALVEALGVESNYRDVSHGDRDSSGALQQRPSQGWGSASESLEKDVSQFLERARQANKGGGSAGQLAQSVQRSAFPGRYDQRSGEAEGLLRRFGGGKGGGGSSSASSSSSRSTSTRNRYKTVPAVSREEDRRALKLQYLQERKRDPEALLSLKAGLDAAQDVPEKRVKVGEDRTTTIREGGSGSGGGSSKSGSSKGGAKGKGSGLHELFWQGQGGINIKKNQRVPQGFVSGHTDHVHVAAGPRTLKRIAKLARKRGLRVGEMEPYDKVDPVHVQGSYHYSGRAADISGDPEKMKKFAREIARKYKK